MAMGGPRVKIAENNANALNSNSQSVINPSSPIYHATLGNKNMYTLLARLGPDAIYAHIMRAAFDPVYGREFSLAHEYERPATRFPLAETTRTNERSENANLVSLLGGSNIDPNRVNPFGNTSIIYSAGNQEKKQEGSYQPYNRNYNRNYRKNEDDATKNPLRMKIGPLYKVASVARAVEQRGREYFSRLYDTFAKRKESGGKKQTSAVQEQKPAYDRQEAQTYILPTGYAGAETRQTSLDTNLEQEMQVPQDVLDATIEDAKRFLESQRRRNRFGLDANESKLESVLSNKF